MTQQPEGGTELGSEKLRMFADGEVSALIDLVEVDWFGALRCCSKRCLDVAESRAAGKRAPRRQRHPTSYFEWLFSQPIGRPQPRSVWVTVRVSAPSERLRLSKFDT
jgi:hypothetical protein